MHISRLLILMIVFSSCKCKDNTIKPIRECYENGVCDVMTCKLDGLPWVAECKSGPLFGCDPVFCNYYKNLGQLDIFGQNLNGPSGGIYIRHQFPGGISPGSFSLNVLDILKCDNCDPNTFNKQYYLDSLYLPGKHLTITKFDSLNHYLEGQFNFRAIEYSTHDTIYITNGNFKLSYGY